MTTNDWVPRGLHDKWKVKADESGGSWTIMSTTGDIIACDLPFGAYADYIVELHNGSIDARRVIELDRAKRTLSHLQERSQEGF